jgi:hypothetical protein
MIRGWITQPNLMTELSPERITGRSSRYFCSMLDDPEIQKKIGDLLRHAGLVRSTGIKVPQR